MLPDDYVKNIISKGLLKEDEEIIDGFIYCKNCKTARMCFLEEFKATCPCVCKCQQEALEKKKTAGRETKAV